MTTLLKTAFAVVATSFLSVSTHAFHLHPISLVTQPRQTSVSHVSPSSRNKKATLLQQSSEEEDAYTPGGAPLYNVLNATMATSRLIYPFAKLRKLVREDDVDDPEWIDGGDLLTEDTLFEEDLANFIRKNEKMIASDEELEDLLVLEKGLKGDNRIRCFDAKNQDSELVYGIGVNRSRKRVVVAFRGTNSKTDILVDLDIRKFEVIDGKNSYEVHNGFRNYLKGKSVENEDGEVLVSKFRIITEELKEIMSSLPGKYNIYITGHSLGGALATYYGLKLAEENLFPIVNVVSYASPFVGTESFREVFRQTELEGKVRHIRVSNRGDCIPTNPCIGGFKHVGVNLRLCPTKPQEIIYEGVENPALPFTFILFLLTFISLLIDLLSIKIGFLSFIPTVPLIPAAIVAYFSVNILLDRHSLPEYRKGLENTPVVGSDFLSKTINEVYEKRLEDIRTGV